MKNNIREEKFYYQTCFMTKMREKEKSLWTGVALVIKKRHSIHLKILQVFSPERVRAIYYNAAYAQQTLKIKIVDEVFF